MRRYVIGMVPAAILAAILAAPDLASAQDVPTFRLTIKNNKFEPDTLTVPANTRFVLIVRNADATPAEFESTGLGTEKVISPGREAIIRVGPLKPGAYPFVDEFHQDTAKGVLTAAGE